MNDDLDRLVISSRQGVRGSCDGECRIDCPAHRSAKRTHLERTGGANHIEWRITGERHQSSGESKGPGLGLSWLNRTEVDSQDVDGISRIPGRDNYQK